MALSSPDLAAGPASDPIQPLDCVVDNTEQRAAAVPTDRGSRLNFRRPNFPAFLAPPCSRGFRFS